MAVSSWLLARVVSNSIAVVLGVPGNALIISVFVRRGVRHANDVGFIALALVDLAASVVFGAKVAVAFLHDEQHWACVFEVVGSRSTFYAALFITVTIAVYRYQLVCMSLAPGRITTRQATYVSAICAAVAFSLTVPFFFLAESINIGGDDFSCTIYGDVHWIRRAYSISEIVVICLSAIAIAILYGCIYKCIRKHQAIKRKWTAQGPGHQQTVGALPSRGQMTAENTRASMVSVISSAGIADQGSVTLDIGSDAVEIVAGQPFSAPREAESPPLRSRPKTARVTSDGTSRRNQSEHKTTQMLIITTAVFFLLCIPDIVIDQLPDDVTQHLGITYPIMLYVVFQLRYVSHFTNVFIYAAVNRQFREGCRLLCNR